MTNRHERRKTAATGARVISTREFCVTAPDGEKLYYWCAAPDMTTPNEEVFATAEHHGPFKSPEEAEKDMHATLLGEQCKVTYGGQWDPSWERKQ